ncbi:MAG: divergent polysaccharide deacetylase family protein [Deltaproteobacteria bacterium]|nr:divergent polysaccharide deacetylase family protein [Deltaproteobacteria bacterium]
MPKRKKQRSASRGRPKGVLLFLGLILCLGLIAGLLHNLPFTPEESLRPAYEENFSVDSKLRREITRIDDAIYDVLYEVGIPEKDLAFLSVKSMHENGHQWDYTDLRIRVPDRRGLWMLKEKIGERLDRLGPSVQYRLDQASACKWIFNIQTIGFPSHKVRLIYRAGEKVPTHKLPRIALIIDDLGYDKTIGRQLIELEIPLTLSVLPVAPFTRSIVNETRERGRELMLHLPMEPRHYPDLNPGPGALLTSMDAGEIKKIMDADFQRVPGAKGFNNHMGSLFTERWDKMRIVLSEAKRRGLFFVDSRTTNKTVALRTAREMGVPAARRNVFLDNDASPTAIKFQMERLLGIARQKGAAVGIGHPNRETLRALKEYLPKLKRDFTLVPVSDLVD